MIRLLRPCGILALCFLLVVPVAVCAQDQAAPPPPEAAPVASSPEQQKEKDMRGPPLADAYLSSLTPEAREMTGFVDIKESDTSPFGMVLKVLDQATPKRRMSEVDKIRSVLSNMRISGVSGSGDTRHVLIGSMAVGEGEFLPKLFIDQADKLKLRVSSIEDNKVTLEFTETDNWDNPIIIEKSFDLHPRRKEDVASLLPGEVFTKIVPIDGEGGVKLPPLMPGAVQQTLEAVQEQNLQSLVERSRELLDAPAAPPSDEQQRP